MGSADPVLVVPYDEAWPSLFLEEWARIEGAIGPWVEEVAHVGSTAVPGLAAKPIIDIMVDDKPAVAMGIEPTRQYGYLRTFEVGPCTAYFVANNSAKHFR